MFLMAKMPKSEKGNNSVKSLSGDPHYVHKLYARYHDPSSNGSPDILFTWLLYYTKCQSRKRAIIQKNIHRMLPKVNQVIYTLDTICEPNIMILAQAALDILFTRSFICSISKSEKGHNSVYFSQNFMKCLSGHLHHVPKLYAWYHDPSSNSSPDILFTMLLYYTKCQSRRRETIQSNIYRIKIFKEFCQKLTSSSTPWTQSMRQILWS